MEVPVDLVDRGGVPARARPRDRQAPARRCRTRRRPPDRPPRDRPRAARPRRARAGRADRAAPQPGLRGAVHRVWAAPRRGHPRSPDGRHRPTPRGASRVQAGRHHRLNNVRATARSTPESLSRCFALPVAWWTSQMLSARPHIRDLSTSTSQPGEDGSKPCSTSQRTASRLRNDHHARITSRSTSVP